jgi:hypothetical protein
MADPRWSSNDSAGPSKPEIATATADVTCKDNSGLVGTWHAADVQYQTRAVEQHSSYFSGMRTTMTKQLAAARAVLTHP